MNEHGNGTRGTWTANDRKERVDALKEFIKKALPSVVVPSTTLRRKDLYKYMLKTFGISRRTIDEYIKDLELAGSIEIQDDARDPAGNLILDPEELTANQIIVWRE